MLSRNRRVAVLARVEARTSAGSRAPLRVVPRAGEPHPEDEALADALVAGEAWAATALWNKHSPMVYRFLQRALGLKADVEDLTQDVFIGVFANVRGLRNREALRSFVLSVAIRKLRSELRLRRLRSVFQLTRFDQLPDQAVPPLDAESRQALRRFYAILDRLSAEQRSAFVLRHMEGLKLEEVAQALEVSLATAKRRLQRASAFVSRHVERDPLLAPYAPTSGGLHGS
jgi:RNA polymerase sigma-70 factor (ECF subfamily)